MLIVMNTNATKEDVKRICDKIIAMGFTPHALPGAQMTAIGITNNTGAIDRAHFIEMPGVEDVIQVSKPCKLESSNGSLTLKSTDDLRIKKIRELVTPHALMASIPVTEKHADVVSHSRQAARDIVHGRDDRLLVIVGPCSIHDMASAMEYATRLRPLIDEHRDALHIIMRVYFEKPRTTIGWKGFVNDPTLDDRFDINAGLLMARQLLSDINALGVSAAVEFLDTITPQYLADFVAWGAIGARTVESQIHRELASGLSMPIGFKNGTDGNVKIAMDAMNSARHSHHFLSVAKLGHTAIVETMGNPDGHVILRGGSGGTNYDEKSIIKVTKALDKARLRPSVMVDCSHGNSQKDYTRQSLVAQSIAQQISGGSDLVMGVMIESHLKAGSQALVPGSALTYGMSITDACIDFTETEKLLMLLAEAVRARRQSVTDTDALAQCRVKIDEIDKTIEALISDRAQVAKDIAEIKRATNANAVMYRPEREQRILEKVLARNKGLISDQHMEEIFRQIMTACLDVEK